MKSRITFQVFIFAFLIFNLGCSKNLFDEIADKDTPEAIFFQAKQEINNRNYSQAILLLESLDPLFMSERSRVPILASAYAGRCGLEFLSLLTNLQNISSSTVMGTLMGAFPLALASQVDDCIEAENILSSLGDASARLGDENLLMAFNSFSKIGTILSSLADTDGDGVVDAGFDQCDNTDLPEAMVRQIGTGIANTLLSLASIGTNYVDDAVNDVTALCALDPNLNVFCTATDPTSFTAIEVQFLRYAIGSSDVGINSCGGDDFSTCAVNNPVCP